MIIANLISFRPVVVIYGTGGLALVLMGTNMIKSKGREIRMESSKMSSSLIGGILCTAFNPAQPQWSATAGLVLLLKGIEIMGVMGVVMVTAGRWLSNFATTSSSRSWCTDTRST